MKHLPTKIKNTVTTVLIALLVLYIIGMQFFPNQTEKLVGFQLYTILTDSMEPVIPTGSVVLSKVAAPDDEVEPDTIITFKVDDLGRDEIFTHYLRKIKKDETGRDRYYTQGAKATRYDDYKTYREDILGTYVFHIPYIGKFILFLKSRLALLELGIILILWIFYRVWWERLDAEEHLSRKGVPASLHLRLKDVDFTNRKGIMRTSGILYNPSEKTLKEFYLDIVYLDKSKNILAETTYAIKKLSPGGKFRWKLEIVEDRNVKDYAVVVRRPKNTRNQGGEQSCSHQEKKDI